ncbi:phosphatidylethanolamine-binding protein [Nanobdella aerobiophila]|uniref:Phosphatidylethanolamine-binding protein n=1 Tax=Nanobdella aerobiophila TaxID=2586965 RepID=A0A915WSN0_9ARCH|nr:YbhB/YbcL family Raf kinase inhibitor-like protein [Nanobdella aerobiophila]BBL45490.1 phosphatidylethanolamine-binding protein [Nanobdella aerobiophila]
MNLLNIKIRDDTKIINVYSSAFKNMEFIPKEYTCEGENKSFGIYINDIPEETKSILLLLEDPDAPGGIFTHWILYIKGKVNNIPENIEKTRSIKISGIECIQGINDFNKIGYLGPCPPRGDKEHRYYTIVLLLNKIIEPGYDINDFLKNINEENIIGYGYFIGLYKR